MSEQGMTGDAQQAANNLVNAAQDVSNSVFDVAEDAVVTVLNAVVQANRLLGDALESLSQRIAGSR